MTTEEKKKQKLSKFCSLACEIAEKIPYEVKGSGYSCIETLYTFTGLAAALLAKGLSEKEISTLLTAAYAASYSDCEKRD